MTIEIYKVYFNFKYSHHIIKMCVAAASFEEATQIIIEKCLKKYDAFNKIRLENYCENNEDHKNDCPEDISTIEKFIQYLELNIRNSLRCVDYDFDIISLYS